MNHNVLNLIKINVVYQCKYMIINGFLVAILDFFPMIIASDQG